MSGLMGCAGAVASTRSAGPNAAGGAANAMIALADLAGSAVLVALMVTVAGVGQGVTYNPLLLMVPSEALPPSTSLTDHFNSVLKLPVPSTVAVNYRLSPGAGVP